VVQLHRAEKQFEEIGFQVVLVGLGTPEQSEKFRNEFSLSFPIICDPKKDLYRTYGLGRGSFSNLASPGILLRGLRTLSRGHAPGIPRGDVFQLPGSFLIDTEGTIRFAHYSKNASDYTPVATLLALKDKPGLNKRS
jgi:peroxiredoxin